MDILYAAKVIWDYMQMKHKLEKSDCIIVLGSHDTRVAERGAQVFLEGLAPVIVFSGYLGALTKDSWERPEAEVFAEIAMKMGVPEDKILIENRSTNTGENFIFSKELLAGKGINPDKIIAVQKPYMERRTYATGKKVWPEVDIMVTSPLYTFEEYPAGDITVDKVISIMAGDLQRIMLYPSKGYQIPQEIPGEVCDAYNFLVEAGYAGRLIEN